LLIQFKIKIILESFQKWLVTKLNRNANSVADGLAREGLRALSECVVLARAPPSVEDRLKSD
jgi:hypothetical protein